MTPTTGPRPLSVLAAGVLFAIAHTQPPLYYSNQNQYFLHGLAAGGFGHLSDDWLANTADPTPVFSAFVAGAYRLCGEWPFHAVFFVALVGYFAALWKLTGALAKEWSARSASGGGFAPGREAAYSRVGGDTRSRSERTTLFWPWAAAIIVAHAGIVRWASDRLFGADYPWFLQCGLANQYLLGAGLQPSVIGVLLIAAVAAYARGKPVLAAVLAAGANWVHATYLLPAALLVAGFIAGEFVNRRWKAGVLCGGVALLMVAPVVAFNLWRFGPSDPAAFAEAQRILADVRIPHHARPARWFDGAAAFQLVWMALGLLALWRTRLFVPLAVVAGLAAAGAGAALATGDPGLALLFPWRVSAVLIPVATAVLFARVFATRGGAGASAGAVAVALACAASAAVYGLHLGYREPESEDAALAFVRDTGAAGDCYLVPARFPKPNPPPGVYSATFAPPPKPTDTVYFEMARFRLATGSALYIDFKSIPYKDADVLEWHRRVANCVRWFGTPDWDDAVVAELRREGVTHVVAPAKLGLRSARLEQLFEGGAYRVYRIR